MNASKVYVRVRCEFDRDGFVHPRAIEWTDGSVYDIDKVLSIRHLYSPDSDGHGECFTICVQGHEKRLFYERFFEANGNRIGRWFVEAR